jgi:hypothetical protein
MTEPNQFVPPNPEPPKQQKKGKAPKIKKWKGLKTFAEADADIEFYEEDLEELYRQIAISVADVFFDFFSKYDDSQPDYLSEIQARAAIKLNQRKGRSHE